MALATRLFKTRALLASPTIIQKCLSSTPVHKLSDRREHCPDYYAVLGLNKSASPVQVKVAYFNKAKKYHPDQNRGEDARLMFELVAEAYEVLSDERKRRNFDEHGTPGVRFGGTTAGMGGPGRARGPDNYDPEELYSKIFKEASEEERETPHLEYEDFASSPSGHASTKEYRLTASFEQAARGADFQVEINVKAICWQCEGSGSAPGYTWNVCPYCEGTGYETEKVGHVLTRHPCSHCNGTSRFIKYKCDKCEGHGVFVAAAEQTVTIPPGSRDGQVFKCEVNEKLLGACARDQQEKYFYVYLNVEESPHFRSDDVHLHSECDVSLAQAMLGGTVLVRGLHRSRLQLEVPPLFEPSRSITAFNEGIARAGGLERGHHFVKVGMKAPEKLSDKQRRLLLAFASLESDREGTVDGLEEREGDAHRYTTFVVEPKAVNRPFNQVPEAPSERAETVTGDEGSEGEAVRRAANELGQQSVDALSSAWAFVRRSAKKASFATKSSSFVSKDAQP